MSALVSQAYPFGEATGLRPRRGQVRRRRRVEVPEPARADLVRPSAPSVDHGDWTARLVEHVMAHGASTALGQHRGVLVSPPPSHRGVFEASTSACQHRSRSNWPTISSSGNRPRASATRTSPDCSSSRSNEVTSTAVVSPCLSTGTAGASTRVGKQPVGWWLRPGCRRSARKRRLARGMAPNQPRSAGCPRSASQRTTTTGQRKKCGRALAHGAEDHFADPAVAPAAQHEHRSLSAPASCRV